MKIIGHRGARGIAPENTLEAFQKAIDCKVDMIETDVRMTSDATLVLVHDPHLMTADEKQILVNTTSHAELLKYQADIVTLEAAIRFVDRRVRLMIEVKPGVPTAPVVTLVRKFLDSGWQPSDFMFNSEHYGILNELRQALPEVERIIQGNWSGARVQYLARKLDTRYILLDQRYLWWGYVLLVSRRYRLVTYTYMWWPGDPLNHFKARRWARFGLWGVVTDYPDRYHLSRAERKALSKHK